MRLMCLLLIGFFKMNFVQILAFRMKSWLTFIHVAPGVDGKSP